MGKKILNFRSKAQPFPLTDSHPGWRSYAHEETRPPCCWAIFDYDFLNMVRTARRRNNCCHWDSLFLIMLFLDVGNNILIFVCPQRLVFCFGANIFPVERKIIGQRSCLLAWNGKRKKTILTLKINSHNQWLMFPVTITDEWCTRSWLDWKLSHFVWQMSHQLRSQAAAPSGLSVTVHQSLTQML